MELLMLRSRHEGELFHADRTQLEELDDPVRASRRPWFVRKLHDLRGELDRVEREGAGRSARVVRFLTRMISLDEVMLRKLRHATHLTIHHPARIQGEQVKQQWTEFLNRRFRKSAWSLVIYLVLCPLSLIAMPLPGPNLLGYWFVYRAICHLLILIGIRRAGGLTANVATRPSHWLDEPIEQMDEAVVNRVSEEYHAPHLHEFIQRHVQRSDRRRGTGPAASTGGEEGEVKPGTATGSSHAQPRTPDSTSINIAGPP